MALITKRGKLRYVALARMNLTSSGSNCQVQSNGLPGLVGPDNLPRGFGWRVPASGQVLFSLTGREDTGSVAVKKATDIVVFIGDTTSGFGPSAGLKPQVGFHLAGDQSGGTDPTAKYPGQASPDTQRKRLHGWAQQVVKAGWLVAPVAAAELATPYTAVTVEGVGVVHTPAMNNHTRFLNDLVTAMSSEVRANANLRAEVAPADVASGGYRNFIVSLAGEVGDPVVRDFDVTFFRTSENDPWQWYADEDKNRAWEYAVRAMQDRIVMLQRIASHVQRGQPALSHPEWAESGIRPSETTSQWLTAEQIESCDAWWDQVLDFRNGLLAAPTPTEVLDDLKGSDDPVADLKDMGYTQDDKSPEELFKLWRDSGSNLAFIDWLKTSAAGFGQGYGSTLLDMVKGGASWLGENVVGVAKEWGAGGTLGFLAGAKAITSDELPPWLIPVGLGVLAFLILK